MTNRPKPPRDIKVNETKIICEHYDPTLDKNRKDDEKKSIFEILFGIGQNKKNSQF